MRNTPRKLRDLRWDIREKTFMIAWEMLMEIHRDQVIIHERYRMLTNNQLKHKHDQYTK